MAIYTIEEGQYDIGDAQFAIIAARFNHHVVERLLDGALAALGRHGVESKNIHVSHVPGAFELPLAAQQIGQHDDISAVITLGCVIRGETPHFDYVCAECARGIGMTALTLGKPVIFGVLTTNDPSQADERAGGMHGNKGEEAALAALEMVAMLQDSGISA